MKENAELPPDQIMNSESETGKWQPERETLMLWLFENSAHMCCFFF